MKHTLHFVKSVKGTQGESDDKIQTAYNYGMRIGEENKRKIYDYIMEHAKGLFPHEIAASLGITRQTVQTHLKELVNETLVLKNKSDGRYYVADPDVGDIIIFAGFMKMISGFLAGQGPGSRSLGFPPEYQRALFNEDAYREFTDRVSGISVSNEICEAKIIVDKSKEKYLFEFANRIGALITYLFIETMRPHEYNTPAKDANSKLQKRNILADNLLRKAVDMKWLFRVFRGLLHSIGLITKAQSWNKDAPIFFELETKEFDRLMATFATVYPRIYEGIEKYWQRERFDDTIIFDWVERNSKLDCKHEWKKIRRYKLKGNFYYCLNKCHLTITEAKMKQLKEREQRGTS